MRALGLALGAILTFGDIQPAIGADPLNSNNQVGVKGSAAPAPHNDFNVVPVSGGSTDVGIGVGYFAGLSRLSPGYVPYVWDLQSAGFVSFKAAGGLVSPYQDVYAKLTVPRVGGARLRLELRPSFTQETTLGYFGIGNRASPGASPGPRYQYGRAHPAIDTLARVGIVDHVELVTGFRYTESSLDVRSGTKLAEDLASGSPEVKRFLGPTSPHGVLLLKYGLALDTRDSEVSAHSGTFDELTLKLSPGGTDALPYRYGQATIIVRGYVPIWPPEITFAARLVGDVLFGDPPFYELARFEDTYALGGGNGVRGPPAQRYYGKVKIFGNAELRAEVAKLRLFRKHVRVVGAGFFDAGRVFADTSAAPELDGRGLGLHYGTGIGARVHSGETFVLRLDVAWSPEAHPLGAYVAAGEAF